MTADDRTQRFLAANALLKNAAYATAVALSDCFGKTEVRVRVLTDEESGYDRLRFEVVSENIDASTRRTLREFASRGIPEGAQSVESFFSFTLVKA